jgi:hypothetical protein
MKEISEELVSKIVSKIYRDTMVTQSNDYFIKHVYTVQDFNELLDADVLHCVLGFLPNTKYRGNPFIMGVIFNKKTKEYEVTVHNPILKF